MENPEFQAVCEEEAPMAVYGAGILLVGGALYGAFVVVAGFFA